MLSILSFSHFYNCYTATKISIKKESIHETQYKKIANQIEYQTNDNDNDNDDDDDGGTATKLTLWLYYKQKQRETKLSNEK